MSAKSRSKTTTAARDSKIQYGGIDSMGPDEDEPASSSSRQGRPKVEVVDDDDDDDDLLEVVAEGPKKRRRVESPVIKRIVYSRRAVDAPRAGISTRLERIEAAQTKITTLVTSNNASTEQLGKRIQKLEKSNADALKRLERVEGLLEKVLERLG